MFKIYFYLISFVFNFPNFIINYCFLSICRVNTASIARRASKAFHANMASMSFSTFLKNINQGNELGLGTVEAAEWTGQDSRASNVVVYKKCSFMIKNTIVLYVMYTSDIC